MDIQVKLVQCLNKQEGTSQATGKHWSAVNFIGETLDPQYPKKICFKIFGDDKVQDFLCAGLTKDQIVTVHFDVESREYNGRWYTECNVWKVDKDATQAPAAPAYTPPVDAGVPAAGESSDLPF